MKKDDLIIAILARIMTEQHIIRELLWSANELLAPGTEAALGEAVRAQRKQLFQVHLEHFLQMLHSDIELSSLTVDDVLKMMSDEE